MKKIITSSNAIVFVLSLCVSTLLPLTTHASSVSGRYIKASGTTITLAVTVGKPAPASLIVEQSLSNKNTIKGASPQPQKISKSGKVKWLVKNAKPGKKQFTIKLASPLQGSVKGIVRYRDPSSGKYLEINITP